MSKYISVTTRGTSRHYAVLLKYRAWKRNEINVSSYLISCG